ncbi:MAG: ACP S-malonyltransferase, partial [Polyangiales bacterium]
MNIAWLFPGQGSQSVGMGREVAAFSAAARDVYARVDAALEATILRSLSHLCFEGPESDLVLTKLTQPAIVATSIAVLAAIRERHPQLPAPSCAAGHSLGEYSALVAAGALTVEEACLVVHLRGAAMQDAVPPGAGAMSAVMGVEPALLETLCAAASREVGEPVTPANFNSPGQIVIAGTTAAVAKASAKIAAHKGKTIALKVSAPFHCSLMKPAADVVANALASIALEAPMFPVIANVDATEKRDVESVRRALVDQVASPVRWQASVEAMVAAGVTHMIEIGPGKALAGMVRRISKDVKVTSVNDVASIDA